MNLLLETVRVNGSVSQDWIWDYDGHEAGLLQDYLSDGYEIVSEHTYGNDVFFLRRRLKYYNYLDAILYMYVTEQQEPKHFAYVCYLFDLPSVRQLKKEYMKQVKAGFKPKQKNAQQSTEAHVEALLRIMPLLRDDPKYYKKANDRLKRLEKPTDMPTPRQ